MNFTRKDPLLDSTPRSAPSLVVDSKQKKSVMNFTSELKVLADPP